jgi:hypothetical protein
LEPFFLFSAHRFFIISDNRFLPAGVRRSPFFLLRVARFGTALVLAADFGSCPSSAAMALLSRSLSLFSSATILPVSKVLSFGRCSYKILSPLPLIPQTKGSTSSHERCGFAIAGSGNQICRLGRAIAKKRIGHSRTATTSLRLMESSAANTALSSIPGQINQNFVICGAFLSLR